MGALFAARNAAILRNMLIKISANSVNTVFTYVLTRLKFMKSVTHPFFYGLFMLFVIPFAAQAALLPGTVATFDMVLQKTSMVIAIAASVFIVFLVCLAMFIQNYTETAKKILFGALVVAILLPTIFFVGSTVYMNSISESKGPVHWHADFEIYVCGQPVKLAGPTSRLSNKVGTPVFHHHSDNRIHVEGVVLRRIDFDLRDFFATIGGELTETSFSIPTESGIREIQNGVPCANTVGGVWQVFMYRQDTSNPKIFRQEKLMSYVEYVLSPHQKIPPGDCFIMEFDSIKSRTEHLCDMYRIEADKGLITIQ